MQSNRTAGPDERRARGLHSLAEFALRHWLLDMSEHSPRRSNLLHINGGHHAVVEMGAINAANLPLVAGCELASQGKWSEAGKELEAIEALVRK